MKTCPYCNEKVKDENAIFCTKCRKRLDGAEPEKEPSRSKDMLIGIAIALGLFIIGAIIF